MKLTQRPEWLILGILFIAANLRAPITGLPTLVSIIQEDLSVTATLMGLLTTMPLLFFAVFSLIGAKIASQLGLERSLFYALVIMIIGVIVRSSAGFWALFIGNNLIAIGIAFGNVLLPGVVKRDFPYRITAITSMYALSMGLVAALVSSISVPIVTHLGFGWRSSLLTVGLIMMLALIMWWPQWQKAGRQQQSRKTKTQFLFNVPLAWYVSLFLGFNSVMYYTIISWLPSMLIDAGVSTEKAGTIHGMMQLASALSALTVIPLMRFCQNQRAVVLVLSLPALIGIAGLWLWVEWAMFWSLCIGFGAGAIFVLALSFVGLRVDSPVLAASLSGMAQFIGYSLAAVGPSLTGKSYDLTQSWVPTLAFCALTCTAMMFFGLLAATDKKIGQQVQL